MILEISNLANIVVNALKITSLKIIQAKRSFVKCEVNNEKENGRAIIEDKIAACEKTAGLRSENSSDLDSACLKVLVPVKIS